MSKHELSKTRESVVFVGNLDERVTEEIVAELMTQVGPVVAISMPKDRVSQSHQGFAFCEFQSPDDAKYAMQVMDQVMLFGRSIRVNSVRSNKINIVGYAPELHISKLNPMVDEKLLYDTFSEFGTIIHIPSIARQPDGTSKGFGTVCLDSFAAADRAIEEMNGKYLMNKPITVSYSYIKGTNELHGNDAERKLEAEAKR
ncbi:hypothetical protein CANCADRAFT_11489, partial [Tortispora caseinolytica NRRL Y-17796]